MLRNKNFSLEKIIFLPQKCIYFLTYRNEHPVDRKKEQKNFLNINIMLFCSIKSYNIG